MVFLGLLLFKTISGKRARDDHAGQLPSIRLNLEMQIVQYAVDMDAHGFGLTLKNIRAVAQDVASKYGIQLYASWKWLSGLYRRHPVLAKRRAQAFECVRASGMNREQVAEYFNVLESCYQICCEGGEVAAMDADFVWNLDETNVQQDQDGCLVIRQVLVHMHECIVHTFRLISACVVSVRLRSSHMVHHLVAVLQQ